MLYVLTMVTTISTAGTVCLVICLFVYFTSNSKEKSEKQFKALALVSLLLCVVFLVISFGQTIDSSIGVMFGKLDADSTTHGSAVARLSSVTSNIHIWKTSPLFGVGLDNSDRLFDYFTRLDYAYYYSINITGTHNTNTYLYQLATYGMFFWGVFTLGLFKVSKLIAARKNSLIVSIFIFILFLFIYMDENLYYSLLPLVLMFFGLKENNLDTKMGQNDWAIYGEKL